MATPEQAQPGAGPGAGQLRGIAPRSRSGAEGTRWAPRAPGAGKVDSLRARRAQEAESGAPLRAHRTGAGRARASYARSRESEPDPARVRTAAPPHSAPPPAARGGAGAERAGLRRGGAGAGSGRARRGTVAKVHGGIGVAAAADDPPPSPRPVAPADPPSLRREACSPEGASPRARRGCFPPREVGRPALRTRLASSPPTGRPAAAPGTWLRRAAAWRRCACRC